MANTNIPTAYGDKQDDWKRRQAIIDAMGAQALQAPQGRQAGRLFVAPSPLEGIAKVFQGYMAGKMGEDLKGEKTSTREAYEAETQKALEAYTSGRQADPRQAAIQAIMSQDPRLQSLGQGDLAAAAKGAIQPKDLLSMQDPRMIPQLLSQGTAGFSPKREVKIIGDIAFDPNSLETLQLGGAKPTTTTLGGDLYQRSPTTGGLKKLDNAPKVSMNVTNSPVIAGQKAGASEYFKLAARQVDALGQRADASQQLLNTLGTLQQLAGEGINSNITSDMATTLQNLGQAVGMKVDTTKLGNTEAYNSMIVDVWQRAVSQFGGNRGVTQSEAEEIKKLTPMARYSPQARERLFAIQTEAAKRNIAAYQEANKSFANAATQDQPDLFQLPGAMEGAYLPAAGGAQPQDGGKVMSLDEYLQGKGAR